MRIYFLEQRKYTQNGIKSYEMQKGREPLRSRIIIQPWELSVLLEEIRMNSDDSYEAVMRLATRVMQAYEDIFNQ